MTQILIHLGLDIVAAAALAITYGIRHHRRDLVLAYAALNIGVFAVVTLLSDADSAAALGFGLFGILSIIRLRSDAITQEEVAYYFVALALGLVNGLAIPDFRVTLLLNVVLLGVMFVADHSLLLRRSRRQQVVLDVLHSDQTALVADLERRLGGRVLHHIVTDVDFVRETTTVDVRFRLGARDRVRV
ncbi:DUF4956 domain-containing protein [Stackebrandtia nassauensis]|nr:DUF4956 domain-containing protein [Stackebrandtia nassauensis]